MPTSASAVSPLSALLFLSFSASLRAATLFWDGGAGTATNPASGGTGTWTNGLANWLSATTGGTAQAWSNANPDSAIFDNAAGTVTLGGPITASGLRFNLAGYTIAGAGNSLTLSPGAVVTENYSSDLTTTINASLAGSDIVFNPLVANGALGTVGQGRVILAASTTHTGTLTVSNGALEVNSGVSIASGTGITVNGSGIYHPSAEAADPWWQTRFGLVRFNGTGNLAGAQAITLHGGTLMRVSTVAGNDIGTLQNVSFNTGENILVSAPSGATAGDTLAITNLTRSATATAQFRSTFGTLGANGNNGKIALANINGLAVTNTNGLLGGWAYANEVATGAPGSGSATAFATWDSALGSVKAAFPDKATNAAGGVLVNQALSTGTPTDNFVANTGQSFLTANLTINSLIAQNDVILNNGATLTLASGGLIYRGNSFWLQSFDNTGKLTSGEASGKLYLNAANTVEGATDYKVRLQITNNGATAVQLIKSGNGRVGIGTWSPGNALSTNNNYTGGTIVQGGVLQGDASNAFGTGPVSVLPGGQVHLSAGATLPLTFSNAFTIAGLGAAEASGEYGAVRFAGNADLSTTVTLAGHARLTTREASDTGRITGVISGAFGIEKTGLGTLTLSNNTSNFTGDVVVGAGTLVASSATGSANSTLGLKAPTRSIIVNTGGTLSFTINNVFGGSGLNAATLPTVFVNSGTLSATRFNVLPNVVLSGGTLTQSTSDAGSYDGFQFIGSVTVTGTAPSVITSPGGDENHLHGVAPTVFDVADVTGSAATDLSVTTGLRNASGDYGSGAGVLTKTGAGTLGLASTNTYTGGTNVNAGTVLVTGSLAGGIVAVASGATLAGTGTIAGNVSVGSGGHLSSGAGAASDTFTLNGGVTMGDGSDLRFTLGPAGLHSTLQRTGTDAWTFDSDQAVTFLNLGAQAGVYNDLISGLSANPGVANWVATLPGFNATFTYDGTGGVDLTVAVPEPGSVTILIAGLGLLAGLRRRSRG